MWGLPVSDEFDRDARIAIPTIKGQLDVSARVNVPSGLSAHSELDPSYQLLKHWLLATTVLAATLLGLPRSGSSVELSFDEFPDGTIIDDQFVNQGVIFSSPSIDGAPSAYGFFSSPVSSPNY